MELGISREALQGWRGPKLSLPLDKPWHVLDECEIDQRGVTHPVRTLFLVGAECPYRCRMCDLWRYTVDGPTPVGAIARQVQSAMADVAHRDWVKLYNASNFFDPRAVPRDDWPAICACIDGFERVIVENHPAIGLDAARAFASELGTQLEVAMGLETVDPQAMALMRKGFTLETFQQTASALRQAGIDLRCFVLLQPPGVPPDQAVASALETIDFAASCGARHISLIPLRAGNGWIDELVLRGDVALPTAATVEALLEAVASRQSTAAARAETVITFDLWNWSSLGGLCTACTQPRHQRLEHWNRTQTLSPPPTCPCALE